MESRFFSALGWNVDPGVLFLIEFILILVLLVLLLVLLSRYNTIRVSYEAFMKGRKAESLEEEIAQIFDDITRLKTAAATNNANILKIIENLKDSYQRVGIVKYDAFKEMGGKLSFSIALLNDNATGFLLNSVHSSDGCYVYTKEIIEGECAISLGDEEKKALMLALEGESVEYNI
ncbi:MAG: DUF4446 family protein [Lachnospiraceae bacterium]|nr:DUF4446 family protein [Lachnospiraceae bacterium]